MGSFNDHIVVLYKIVNSEDDAGDPLFNAFTIPRTNKPTLALVKQRCGALYALNQMGPEGYHWRVCVEDKPLPGGSEIESKFSWWDVQDENASLPVKEATQNQVRKLFAPSKSESYSDQATKAAKGAFKSFGKAVTSAVAGTDSVDSGPPVAVMAFKLLDVVKMHDDFEQKHPGRGGHIPQMTPQQSAPRSTGDSHGTAQTRRPPPSQQRPPARSVGQQQAPEASLMDFGDAPQQAGQRKTFHHTKSSPSTFQTRQSQPPANETRAQKLKREYAKKASTSSRVWDEVDQRWVEKSSSDASSSLSSSGKKAVGISLDAASAVGKSAHVAAAVNKRVNDMQQAQAKALQEVRDREERKKRDEAEEDEVRKRLEPKIKAWSEEYGKKKQLRALLGSLHTILWDGAKWKPISIGDLMEDSKCKKFYHKATLVVHPDKTHTLNPEQRFLAKRIFDALTHAKTDFDSGKP